MLSRSDAPAPDLVTAADLAPAPSLALVAHGDAAWALRPANVAVLERSQQDFLAICDESAEPPAPQAWPPSWYFGPSVVDYSAPAPGKHATGAPEEHAAGALGAPAAEAPGQQSQDVGGYAAEDGYVDTRATNQILLDIESEVFALADRMIAARDTARATHSDVETMQDQLDGALGELEALKAQNELLSCEVKELRAAVDHGNAQLSALAQMLAPFAQILATRAGRAPATSPTVPTRSAPLAKAPEPPAPGSAGPAADA